MAPPGRAVEIVVVLRGEVRGQFVVNSIFSKPDQCGLRWVFDCRNRAAKFFDVHSERTVLRQIHSLFRHNDVSVKMGVEVDHGG